MDTDTVNHLNSMNDLENDLQQANELCRLAPANAWFTAIYSYVTEDNEDLVPVLRKLSFVTTKRYYAISGNTVVVKTMLRHRSRAGSLTYEAVFSLGPNGRIVSSSPEEFQG